MADISPTSFHAMMDAEWSIIEGDAERSRDPNLAGPELSAWYRTLSMDDRRQADEVLASWAQSPDKTRQFNALEVISVFNIRSALPALERLADRLLAETGPEAHFLRLKVLRKIDKLQRSPGDRDV